MRPWELLELVSCAGDGKGPRHATCMRVSQNNRSHGLCWGGMPRGRATA